MPCITAEIASTSGRVQADAYVFAAGLGIPDLAKKAGVEVPLSSKPATLNVYTVPAPPLLQHMLLSGVILRCSEVHACLSLWSCSVLARVVLRCRSCINAAYASHLEPPQSGTFCGNSRKPSEGMLKSASALRRFVLSGSTTRWSWLIIDRLVALQRHST